MTCDLRTSKFEEKDSGIWDDGRMDRMNSDIEPYTQQSQLHAGVQVLFLRCLEHFGRSSEAKDRNSMKQVAQASYGQRFPLPHR